MSTDFEAEDIYIKEFLYQKFWKADYLLRIIKNTVNDFIKSTNHSLCEKCPNTEFFLVRILLYSD